MKYKTIVLCFLVVIVQKYYIEFLRDLNRNGNVCRQNSHLLVLLV